MAQPTDVGIRGKSGGSYTPPKPQPAPAPVASGGGGGGQTVTMAPPGFDRGAMEAAASIAFQRDFAEYQDKWHAQEMAEQAAMRELQKQIALGTIGGKPTLERQISEGGLLGYYGGQPTLERELGQGNLGLGYLQLLASQRGPTDWISYWNTTRNAQQTSLPAWAASLSQGLQMPAWQAPTWQPLPVQQVWGGQGAAPQATAQQAGAMPTILPHQITASQWRNMLPSEQQGLQGLVEAQGGWWPDFQQQMYNAFPTGQASRQVTWAP